MKVVLVVLAVASAVQAAPYTFISGGAIPIDGGYPYTDALGFSTYAHGAVSPLTYSHVPAVVPQTYAVAPAPGYFAQTRGATHIAPLPAGSGYASHHINLAAAPGTT